MITTDIEEKMRTLQSAIKLRLDRLGEDKSKVLRHEAGLLWRTLINLSFPNNPAKKKRDIEEVTLRKFHQISDSESTHSGDSAKAGHGDVTWTGSHPFALYGIAKDVDFRDASVEQLEALYYGRGGSSNRQAGRARYPGAHGRQDVFIWQKVSAKKGTIRELIRKWQSHVGRLKSGWVPAWQACGSPGDYVPNWIQILSRAGAAGFNDNTLDRLTPSFTAINRERGARTLRDSGKIEAALRIRAKAIVERLARALHSKGQSLEE